MNIFFLSRDPEECAHFHNNKHVVKMILETAQLLSTAHHVLDEKQTVQPIYKPTHKNHPSAIWTRQSRDHYIWLWKLLHSLCLEYTYRYKKEHKVARCGLLHLLQNPPSNIPNVGWLSDPTPAMPDEYKDTQSVIQSYRNYYKGAKSSFAFWKNRNTPSWFV